MNAVQTSSARWWAMGATALTLLVVGLDMTVLNVALPDMAVDLKASTAQLQWFADAYLLVLAAVMLPAGMLGDRLGRKGFTLSALAVFGAGSVWCALATTPGSLIAARVLLGFGAAVIVPLAMSAVVVLFDPPERPRAVLVLSMATMIGLPLGPILGGFLLQHFWWGSVFVINVPVILFALVAVALTLPAGRAQAAAKGFDTLGVVLSGAGLLALTYGVIEGPARGWGDGVVLGTVVGGLVLLGLFLLHERRLTGVVPVFDYAVWAIPAFRWGAVIASIVGLGLFGVFFTLPQYFRAVLGADAFGTGLRTLPLVLGMLVAMQFSARVGVRFAPRVMAPIGCLLLAAAMAVGATTTVDTGFGMIAVWTTVAGLGVGVALFSAQNIALMSLPRERAATGSALIQTLRQAGSVMGVAVLGALLNDRYRDQVSTAGLSDAAAGAVRESVQSGLQVAQSAGSPDLAHSVTSAFVAGMDASLWASAGVAIVAAVLAAWLLPSTPGAGAGAGAGVGAGGTEAESADVVDAEPSRTRTP